VSSCVSSPVLGCSRVRAELVDQRQQLLFVTPEPRRQRKDLLLDILRRDGDTVIICDDHIAVSHLKITALRFELLKDGAKKGARSRMHDFFLIIGPQFLWPLTRALSMGVFVQIQ
jgi:hypothetical protein